MTDTDTTDSMLAVRLDPAVHALAKQQAADAGMSIARYLATLLDAYAGRSAEPPPPRRQRAQRTTLRTMVPLEHEVRNALDIRMAIERTYPSAVIAEVLRKREQERS